MISELVWLVWMGGRFCVWAVEWTVQLLTLTAKLLLALAQVIVGLALFVGGVAAMIVWGALVGLYSVTRWGVRGVARTIESPEQ